MLQLDKTVASAARASQAPAREAPAPPPVPTIM